MKVTFIGSGNMAGALVGGLIARGTPAGDVFCIDPSEPARAAMAQRYDVAGASDASALPTASELIVLAVKPQHMRAAANALAPRLGGRLVVSVAAGIRCRDLARWLGGHTRIVRAMPNTPALVGLGMTGLFAAPGATADDRAHAEALMRAVGEVAWIDDEALMDAVTAVSGSGPAYVFHLIGAMQAAGEKLGLPAATARTLAVHTARGAATLAAQSADSAATLRERVTSKGGTTERALDVLREGGVFDTTVRAIVSAAERGREMGDEFGKDI